MTAGTEAADTGSQRVGELSVRADTNADPRAYIRIATSVRQQIAAGIFVAGDPLPSITTLVRETGNSRQTVGRALRMLEREALVTRIAGLGYYVAGATRMTDGDSRR